MLENYLPILIFLVVGILVGGGMLVAGFVLGEHRPDAAKNAPYECGFEAFGNARMKFDVRYYLVAILFIVFDLEIAFLFPWAVVLDHVGGVGADDHLAVQFQNQAQDPMGRRVLRTEVEGVVADLRHRWNPVTRPTHCRRG